MQIIGYVFSRKEKKLVPITRELQQENNFEDKLFSYFKEQLERKLKGAK